MVNIEIDVLTNSILQVASNQVFETMVIEAHSDELRNLKNWNFNWLAENQKFHVFKLTTLIEPETIQGLISWKLERGFVFVSLVENAPLKIGKNQLYQGVAGNLFAFACKKSFENGFQGFVGFDAKTNLIEHYKKSLNAKLIGSQRMMIETPQARYLVEKYFKNL